MKSADAAALLVPPLVPESYVNPGAIGVDEVIADLDRAGIRQAAVLSVAYWFASPLFEVSGDRSAKVRTENDSVSQQVARYPRRLVAFCSFNPISDDALSQLEHCANDARMTGIKVHLANSAVDFENADHVGRLRATFAAANDYRLPIIAHLWNGADYDRSDSETFLRDVLPAAPDILIQIAHLSGTGPGYGPDEALAVYAEAIERGDPTTRNLWFDVATSVTMRQTEEQLVLIARRLRQIGLNRILFGSDASRGLNPPGGQAWEVFKSLPLEPDEFRQIARNKAPYFDGRRVKTNDRR